MLRSMERQMVRILQALTKEAGGTIVIPQATIQAFEDHTDDRVVSATPEERDGKPVTVLRLEPLAQAVKRTRGLDGLAAHPAQAVRPARKRKPQPLHETKCGIDGKPCPPKFRPCHTCPRNTETGVASLGKAEALKAGGRSDG